MTDSQIQSMMTNLVSSIRNHHMTTNLPKFDIDIYTLPSLLDNVITVIQNEQRNGILVGGRVYQNYMILQIPENLVIVGDIHGDIETLNHIITKISNKGFFSNSKNKIIFLGDYIDRGSSSIEVLCRICKLKISYPNSVILMRGNHEAVVEFPFPSHDLPEKISQVFATSKESFYSKILKFFQLLTVLVIIEKKLFLVHGGLPVDIIEKHDEFEELLDFHDHSLEEFLWNDPRPIEAWEASRRKYGKHFGKSVTRKWLEASNTKVVVRGHEPCQGFRIDHDNMMFTIFSCKESYPKFDAAYVQIDKKELSSLHNASDLIQHTQKIHVN